MTYAEQLEQFLTTTFAVFATQSGDTAQRLGEALVTVGQPAAEPLPASVPACAWLKQAITDPHRKHRDLLWSVAQLAPVLPWLEVPPGMLPPAFYGRHAYTEVVGPDGAPMPSKVVRVGLYLQAPETDYPAHAHDAEELYLVLSGWAHWNAGPRRFIAEPGQVIRHAPEESHAMRTGEAPFLALWAWLGAINGDYWLIDGPHWPAAYPVA